MKKRLFAGVLSLVMLLSLLPATAFAAGESNTTLPEAVNGVITLESDLVLSSTWIINDTVTLNLNGHTISSGTTQIWNDPEEEAEGNLKTWSLISVRQGGNLTINGEGTLKTVENDCYAVDVQDGATCTINGGNYKGNVHAVYVLEGTLNVTGGEFSIQQTYPNDTSKAYEFTLNCYDANHEKDTAKINVSGGTFFKFDPANNQAEGANTNFTQKVYGDNVIEKHGINRDRTGDREKTRYLCGKQGIFTRDRALIRPGFIRQLETRASTRSASFFHALGSPGRPHNGGGAAGAYCTSNGAKPLKQGHLRAKRGPLGPSRKSQQQTKRTGFAAHGHSIAETAPEGKRASCANGALIRA